MNRTPEHAQSFDMRGGAENPMLRIKAALETAPHLARRDLVKGKVVFLMHGNVVAVDDPTCVSRQSEFYYLGPPIDGRTREGRLDRIRSTYQLAEIRQAADEKLRRLMGEAGVTLEGDGANVDRALRHRSARVRQSDGPAK